MREIEVARYMMQDFSNKEIGENMTISEGTVETHRKHIKEKLGAKSKRDLYGMLRMYL
ncbi:MAG: helix-turn-helix transcriptional regulator [Bacteroidota bacterium]|nr:helix-turn-helix transcriptional regulator [Bacteroidota bacterium]